MRYEVILQEKGKLTTYILKDHETKTEAEILPAIGNNLIAYRKDGVPYISEAPNIMDYMEDPNFYRYGSAILFPPNRVKNATYSYKGRTYELVKNENPNHLHGELCSRAWTVTDQGADEENGSFIKSTFSMKDFADIYAYFPHHLVFEMTYSLKDGKITAHGKVINKGDDEAPFALGFHPYFHIPNGEDKSIKLQVPASKEWPVNIDAFVQDLPSKTTFAEELNKGVPVDRFEDLFCSLITLKNEEKAICSIHYKETGMQLDYELDRTQFPFLIIFKPNWSSAVSLEPYSYVTDAFNLHWDHELTGAKGVKPKETISYEWGISVRKIS